MRLFIQRAAKRIPVSVQLAAWTVTAITLLWVLLVSAPSAEALFGLAGPGVELVKRLRNAAFWNRSTEAGWSLSRPYELRNGAWRCDIYYLDAQGEVKSHSVGGANAEEAQAEARRRGLDLFGK